MDYDDGHSEGRLRLGDGDPLPPEDWAGFGIAARTEAIYTAHAPRLNRFFRRTARAQDAADLVQECFRRLAANRTSMLALIEQPGAYLFRTARNLLAERARSDTRRLAADHHAYSDEEVAGADPHAMLEARDMIRRIEEQIARLSPKTRDIFLMHRIDGLRYDEIARLKGMSVKGVEKQIAKAMIAVRRARDRRP